MRIIGTIDHPSLKISIFKNDHRLSVKFENMHYEQTFKFGTDERLSTVEAIQKLVDATFVSAVLANFQHMHQTRISAMARLFPVNETELFEEII